MFFRILFNPTKSISYLVCCSKHFVYSFWLDPIHLSRIQGTVTMIAPGHHPPSADGVATQRGKGGARGRQLLNVSWAERCWVWKFQENLGKVSICSWNACNYLRDCFGYASCIILPSNWWKNGHLFPRPKWRNCSLQLPPYFGWPQVTTEPVLRATR